MVELLTEAERTLLRGEVGYAVSTDARLLVARGLPVQPIDSSLRRGLASRRRPGWTGLEEES